MLEVSLLEDNGSKYSKPNEQLNYQQSLPAYLQVDMTLFQSVQPNTLPMDPSRMMEISEMSRKKFRLYDTTKQVPNKDQMSTLLNNLEMMNCQQTVISEIATMVPAFTSRQSAKDNIVSGDLFQLPQENGDATVESSERTETNHVVAVNHVQPVKIKQQKCGLSKLYQSKIKKMKINKTSQCCSICQQDFKKDEIILQLPCKHIFHRQGCIKQWLKCSVRCPLCKMDLESHFRKQKEEEQAQWQ